MTDTVEPTGAAEPALVAALTQVAAVEDPHRDDLLFMLLQILDSGQVADESTDRAARPRELDHSRALIYAFALRLAPDNGPSRSWELSPYARALSDRFGPPMALDAVPEDVIEVWELYAGAELPPFLKGHLWDLVASRRRSLPHSAREAIAALRDLRGVVPDVYAAEHLARALELATQFRLDDVRSDVEDDLLEHAESVVRAGGGLGTFARSVAPLVDRGLRSDEVEQLLGHATQAWPDNELAAETLFELGHRLVTDPASRSGMQRELTRELLRRGNEAAEGLAALKAFQQAHSVATKYGHADLAAEAMVAMRAIEPESLGLQTVSVEAPLPPGFVESSIKIIAGHDGLVPALIRLVAHCPTGDLGDLRTRAEAGEGTSTFAAVFGTTVLNAELLPKGLHAGDDLAAALAHLQDIHVQLTLPVLTRALDRLNGAYDVGIPDLECELALAGRVSKDKAAKLARCLRRFWREDYEGAAYVGSTLVEGLLRERLIAVGRDPYQLPRADGTSAGKYKMLGQLITMARGAGLDDSWAAFLTYALADPMYGYNLRNELLHGAVDHDPGPMSAALVLVAALHLTLAYIPTQP